jgi:hypothetical protein
MQCANHLKQMGIGVHNFHDTQNGIVPLAIYDQRVTIFPLLYPYIEQQSLYEIILSKNNRDPITNRTFWSSNLTLEEQKGFGSVSVFRCPTRRGGGVQVTDDPGPSGTYNQPSGHPGPKGDYCAIASTPNCQTDFISTSGGDAHFSTYTSGRDPLYWTYHHQEIPQIACTINMHHGPFRVAILETPGSSYANWHPRDTFARWIDGTTNVIMFAEKHIPLGRINLCKFDTSVTDSGASQEETKQRNAYDCSYLVCENDIWGKMSYVRAARTGTDSAGHPTHTNTFIARPEEHLNTGAVYAGFGSWHPGICQFLFGDGSIRSLENTTSIRVYGNLATVDSGVTVTLP